MSLDWNQFIESADLSIRQGRPQMVRLQLSKIYENRHRDPIPRPYLAILGGLCRRSELPYLALRILNPWVRPKARSAEVASFEEKAEYGASLAQVGATRESLQILDSLDGTQVPQALLFGAFARFSVWDYESSVSLLKRYCAHPRVSAYQRLTGEVNLCAALVLTEKWDETFSLLESVLEKTQRGNHLLLQGNALGILAQLEITRGNLYRAKDRLETAEAALSQVEGAESLIIQKWKAILALKEGRGTHLLSRVRESAFNIKDWETLRDCDFHQANFTRDLRRAKKVYFGTPFPDYRMRALKTWGDSLLSRSYFDWAPIKIPQGEYDTIHDSQVLQAKPGQIVHRLFKILVSDFYKPYTLARIHSDLFPNRHFNPHSSPTLIHQAIRRLKIQLKHSSAPIQIVEKNGFYSTQVTKPCKIRVMLPVSNNAEAIEIRLSAVVDTLQQHFGRRKWGFSRRDAEKVLDISARSVNVYLTRACEMGWVTAQGNVRGRRYHVNQVREDTSEE